jgi:uncharacterized protein
LPDGAATDSVSLAPLAAGDRIQTIDVLRGFALFGILWMNTPGNGEPITGLDRGVLFLGKLLADGKFFSLYSFLFGLGFAVQLLRAEQRGGNIVPVYLRRLGVLLLIGVAHSIFLWQGDILQNYAVLGVLLLPVRNYSPRALLRLATLCLVGNAAVGPLVDAIGPLRRPEPAVALEESLRSDVADLDQQVVWQRTYAEAENGSYGRLVTARAERQLGQFSNPDVWFDGIIFCMFLLGLWAGRRRIFQETAAHLPLIRHVMWCGLAIGLACNLVWALKDDASSNDPLYTAGRPALCLFYAAGLTLLMQDSRWRGRLRIFSWAGRMGLTNYLMQSLLFTTAFYHYGFRLSTRQSPPLALIFTILTFALQIAVSRWWLVRFRYGPMEWIWRSLTYLKLQPMRVARA